MDPKSSCRQASHHFPRFDCSIAQKPIRRTYHMPPHATLFKEAPPYQPPLGLDTVTFQREI